MGAFAGCLDHPRWMHLLPNGDVLVAETNAPAKKDSGISLRKIFMARAMKRAGAATKSVNRITLLRDTDGDGVADLRTPFIEKLTRRYRPPNPGFCLRLAKPQWARLDPQSGRLWVAVNERDEIGDDLVPEYMTSLRDGGFYGWPYSYFGQNVDVRAKPPRPDLVANAIKPDYALGAHTASLGLAFDQALRFARHTAAVPLLASTAHGTEACTAATR